MKIEEANKKLLACPLCKSRVKMEVRAMNSVSGKSVSITCSSCGLHLSRNISLEYSAIDELVKQWNSRPEAEDIIVSVFSKEEE